MSDPETLRKIKQRRYNRRAGRPALVEGDIVRKLRAKVLDFNERGMTYQDMERQVDYPFQGLRSFAVSTTDKAYRTNLTKIAALRFDEKVARCRTNVPTRRRVQALIRAGYPQKFLADKVDLTISGLNLIAHGRHKTVMVETERRVAELYRKLELADPLSVGVTEFGMKRAQRVAEQRGFIPASCWDPDTIANPEAFPEWTGACGTTQGAGLHTKYGIPRCKPCQAAVRVRREELKAERAAND